MPTPDIFGRKPVLIITGTISTILILSIIFIQSMTQVYIWMFFIGFTILVRGTTSYVYYLEIIPQQYAKKSLAFLTILEKSIIWFIPLVFYLTKDWSYIISIFGWISVACIIVIWFIPESPKFLKEQNEAESKEGQQTNMMFYRNNNDTLSQEMDESKTFWQMLKEGNNLKNLLIIIWWWSFTSSSYYLVSFFIKYFKGSIYINSFLFGIASLIGVTLFSILINYISTKRLFILSFLMTFIGSLGFTLTRNYESLVPLWILLMVVSLSIQFSLCYYTNVELFSPTFRTRIFSLWNIIARCFTVISPMLVELMDNPIIIISVWAVGMIMLATQLSPVNKYK